jgi:tetratricopeptide (TPR) repeat protein
MKKCVSLRPTNINYLLGIAALYEEIWDFDSAKKYYFKVLEYDPTNEFAKSKINEI